MKRVLVLIFLLLITGCTESKITCNKKEKEEYVTMNQIVTINFKGNKIKNAEYKINAVLEDEYKDSNQYFVSVLKEQFSTFKKDYGIKVEINENKKGATLKMNLTKDNFEKLYLDGESETKKEEIIKDFKEKGYVCD